MKYTLEQIEKACLETGERFENYYLDWLNNFVSVQGYADFYNLPLDYATPLHEAHGKSVRVEGHCGCPSPEEYCGESGVGSYDVDNPDGLKALADVLKEYFN